MSANGKVQWDEVRSYHGQAVIKEPIWTWEIPLYFFTGGLAGASAGLACLAELRDEETLSRGAWAGAMVGIVASPALLTSDLGRPKRFLNMLRMFKVTSPMSVGSWLLSASGAATTVAAANAWLGWFPRTGTAAKAAAGLLGLPLSTYTAALISNTAVPVWHEAHRMLPFVFGSGAALSAGAAGMMLTPPAHARAARRLALGAAVAELGSKELMEHRLGRHAEAYKQGAPSIFSHISRGCILAGAALLSRRGGESRGAAIAAGALLSAGAVSARWSVFKAGFQSAANPKYVIAPQRAQVSRGERRGGARRKARTVAANPELGSPATAPR